MQKILFVDLDDTLFQSHGKCTSSSELIPLAYLKDGRPISYASISQMATLQMFQKEMLVIPVTARNLDAFSRVKINFHHGAVLNYGGVVLNPDLSIDEFWMERSRNQSLIEIETLNNFKEYIEIEAEKSSSDLSIRIIYDFSLPFYVVVKSLSGDTTAITKIAELCQTRKNICNLKDYRIHVNGNNLAILPGWLDKRNAVKYLLETSFKDKGPFITFGMGDSLIDIGFMASCHYMIVPTTSQIAHNRLGEI